MKDKPNIINIIWHDLGCHLSCYDAGSVKSPQIDKMAAEGAIFFNHYSTGAVCVPSRCSILTGRYPHAHNLWRFSEEEVTLPATLRKAGYDTYRFGFREEKEFYPLGKVVDLDTYAREILGYNSTHGGLRSTEDIVDGVIGLLTDRISDSPFYLCAQLTDIHRPNEEPVKADRISSTMRPHALPTLPDSFESLSDVASFESRIERADAAVGKLLDFLDANGFKKDTIVMLTTDHGMDLPRAKMTLYDAGTHVAMILWGCGINPGLRDNALHSHIDVFPTLLELAGVPIPLSVQGVSFAGALYSGEDRIKRNYVISEKAWESPLNPARAIRTERYKYIRTYCPGQPITIPPAYVKKVGSAFTDDIYGAPMPEEQLYDLDNDACELENLAGHSEYEDIRKLLSIRLDEVLTADSDPILHTADYLAFLHERLPDIFR